jgi:hypothetical protein
MTLENLSLGRFGDCRLDKGGRCCSIASSCANPQQRHSLAWAAWIIARLGGWNGYPSSKPPGPITLRHGLEYFHAIAKGWNLRDVFIP